MIQPILLLFIPALPLIMFLIIGLVGRTAFPRLCGTLSTLGLLAAFGLAAKVGMDYFLVSGKVNGIYEAQRYLNFEWLSFSPTLSIHLGILLDPISVMMLVVVTFISLMVHVYSLGYMKDEPRRATYFGFLSLFTFSMLGLVMSINMLQLYIFWELVGLSSFLLIGFYYGKNSAAAAAKKAFIVTRFADMGLLIGILILSHTTNTLDFKSFIEIGTSKAFLTSGTMGSFMGISAITWGLSLVFMGAAGKSAMFPLHIWLPDAMEGPTPVSALIHAATMVVAGVYLVARIFPVFAIASPHVLTVISYIGAGTAVFAALVACTQTDIKRVLAYSTISQIGFMVFSLGVSGYGGEAGLGYMGAMFHLFTHAMFKALLFLGAGSVIHYVHSNEMKHMGGLRKKMPITHLTFLIGCLAICGLPPFAGFFSKEEILMACYTSNKIIYGIALGTATLTSFYIFRLYLMVFWQKEFIEHAQAHGENKHKNEGTWEFLLPLLILALASIGVGFIPFGQFISSDGKGLTSEFNALFSIAPVGLSLLAIGLAAKFYGKTNQLADQFIGRIKAVYHLVVNKFYMDELYLFVTHKILFNLVGRPVAWFDKAVVNGVINGTGNTAVFISDKIKAAQSGKLQDYALWFLTGLAGIILVLIYLWI